MKLPAAQKHQFKRSPGLVQPYADLYRFGDAGPRDPLVLYVGGAISRSDYIRRSRTSPDPIATEFAKAYDAVRPGPVALLICPCPIDIRGFDGFLEHYDRELTPAVGGVPSALACVGYSNGSQFATFVAVAASARSLALIAAAGMQLVAPDVRPMIQAALRKKKPDSLPSAVFFRNVSDSVSDPVEVRRWLGWPAAAISGTKPGRHSFRDYSANGTTVAAFRFALEGLTQQGHG